MYGDRLSYPCKESTPNEKERLKFPVRETYPEIWSIPSIDDNGQSWDTVASMPCVAPFPEKEIATSDKTPAGPKFPLYCFRNDRQKGEPGHWYSIPKARQEFYYKSHECVWPPKNWDGPYLEKSWGRTDQFYQNNHKPSSVDYYKRECLFIFPDYTGHP